MRPGRQQLPPEEDVAVVTEDAAIAVIVGGVDGARPIGPGSRTAVFQMNATEQEWESAPDASEVDHVPDHFERLSYDEMQQGIQGLNKAAENGDVTFRQEGDRVEADWHVDGDNWGDA